MHDQVGGVDSVAVALEREPQQPPSIGTSPVAIIGAGVVGRALGVALEGLGREVLYHDPPAGQHCEALDKCPVAFICVPTPHDEEHGVDISAVRDALDSLPDGTIAVIRSTVLPGTTEALQQQYPALYLMHVPEFLTESRAEHDEAHPARVIIGYTEKSKRFEHDVQRLLPDSPFVGYVVAREAEAIKYFANAFYALKVSYSNQFFDLCERLGVYYAMVRECGLADPMMAPEHTTISHNGYRGFGGKCLPKDTMALCHAARAVGAPMTVLEAALEYNETLAPPR